MPTKREREYYRMGFTDGLRIGRGGTAQFGIEPVRDPAVYGIDLNEPYARDPVRGGFDFSKIEGSKPKRKLSAWNKFVRANSKKKIFRYRDGKLNLKKMGVAFRKKTRR